MTILFNPNWYLVAIIVVALLILAYCIKQLSKTEKPHEPGSSAMGDVGIMAILDKVENTMPKKVTNGEGTAWQMPDGSIVSESVKQEIDEGLVDYFKDNNKGYLEQSIIMYKASIERLKQMNVGLQRLSGRLKQVDANKEEILRLQKLLQDAEAELEQLKS